MVSWINLWGGTARRAPGGMPKALWLGGIANAHALVAAVHRSVAALHGWALNDLVTVAGVTSLAPAQLLKSAGPGRGGGAVSSHNRATPPATPTPGGPDEAQGTDFAEEAEGDGTGAPLTHRTSLATQGQGGSGHAGAAVQALFGGAGLGTRPGEDAGAGLYLYGIRLAGAAWTSRPQAQGAHPATAQGHLSSDAHRVAASPDVAALPQAWHEAQDEALPLIWLGAVPKAAVATHGARAVSGHGTLPRAAGAEVDLVSDSAESEAAALLVAHQVPAHEHKRHTLLSQAAGAAGGDEHAPRGVTVDVPVFASAERQGEPLVHLRLPTSKRHADSAHWALRGVTAYVAPPSD